jgi:hypothetical protein
MSRKTVTLLELSEYERAKVIEEAKTILRQKMEEARLFKSVVQSYETRVRSEKQKDT